MSNKIIWLVDENENQSRTYARQLRKVLPQSISVERLFPPYPSLEEYSHLIENRNTTCIVVDQKLKDTGIATYTGIELAQYLRRINDKIPIYILTNFPDLHDEYTPGEWSVEDIIDKKTFTSPIKTKTLISRLIRRIDIFADIRDERTQRFDELLDKKVRHKLSVKEAREYEELQIERLAPTEARSALGISEGLDELLELNRKLLTRLSKQNPESPNE